jgi:hypothetical protein
MLIENKIVLIKIPKNASSSIYKSFILNDFNVDEGNRYMNYSRIETTNEWNQSSEPLILKNFHQTYDELSRFFPKNKYTYVGIHRDSTDRFISAWKYMMNRLVSDSNVYKSYRDNLSKFNEFTTNEVITFFKEIMPKLYTANDEEVIDVIREYICSDFNEIFHSGWRQILRNFQSQYYWGLNSCDLIFEYEKMNLFEEYVSSELNKEFKLVHVNDTTKTETKLTKSIELINFVENYIDSPFKTKKML